MFCPHCGKQMSEDAAFCQHCGREIVTEPVTAAEPEPTPPAAVSTDTAQAAPEYAGFWIRFLAALIDGIVIVVVAYLFRSVLRFRPFGSFLFGLGIRWLYFAIMESSDSQATLGKQIANIYVTDMAGHRLSFERATGRYFAKLISDLTLLIGYIIAAFTARKQALHDIIAGTLVLRRRNS